MSQGDSMVAALEKREDKGDSVAQYLGYVATSLESESLKCTNGYLDPLTRKLVTSVLQKVLLERHADKIIEVGLDDLLDKDKVQDLKLFFGLLKKVDMLEKLKLKFTQYINVIPTNKVTRLPVCG
jgi:Cullin family